MIRSIIVCVACLSVACYAFGDVWEVPNDDIDSGDPNYRSAAGNECIVLQKGTSMVCRAMACNASSGSYSRPTGEYTLVYGPMGQIYLEPEYETRPFTHVTHSADFDTLECRNAPPNRPFAVCVGRVQKPCVTGKYYECLNDIPEPCWAGTHQATQIVTTSCCSVTDVHRS